MTLEEQLDLAAREAELEVAGKFVRRARRMEDFRYDEVQEKFWDTTTGILLSAKSVNGAIPREYWPTMKVNKKVKHLQPATVINAVETGLTVETSTWWPGRPQFLQNVVVTDRGAMTVPGAVSYNTYMAPDWSSLNPTVSPEKWINHVKRLWPRPEEHEHLFDYWAHAIQCPHEKVNHGVVLSGAFGIGKDSALHPVRVGVGVWNSAEIDPDAIASQYNGFIKAVLLVVNEVRPHEEDHHASEFYNRLKPILAAPPEMLPMQIKYANTIHVRNVVHVCFTANDPLKMYIPPDDRRLFVAHSNLPDQRHEEWYQPYFEDFWAYLEGGGTEAAVKWLLTRDIGEFKPGAPPPMTLGKKMVIESGRQVRRTAIDDLLERFVELVWEGKKPAVIFAADLHQFIQQGPVFDDSAALAKLISAKNFHYKMDERGYMMVRNGDTAEWRAGKFRSRVAFVRKDIADVESPEAIAADELTRRPLLMEFSPKVDNNF